VLCCCTVIVPSCTSWQSRDRSRSTYSSASEWEVKIVRTTHTLDHFNHSSHIWSSLNARSVFAFTFSCVEPFHIDLLGFVLLQLWLLLFPQTLHYVLFNEASTRGVTAVPRSSVGDETGRRKCNVVHTAYWSHHVIRMLRTAIYTVPFIAVILLNLLDYERNSGRENGLWIHDWINGCTILKWKPIVRHRPIATLSHLWQYHHD